ncbi:MAG: CYTH domain-containing protein [Saprospiraceae bacterium]
MGIEIERKYLLKNEDWRKSSDSGTAIKQGYLNSHVERTVRVRVFGDKGFITIKGKTDILIRKEYEYEIPLEEALEQLELCEKPLIEKVRFIVHENGHKWEIDEFYGENAGLILVEVELARETDEIHKPDWLGEEVTNEIKYYNSNLIKNPYANW